MPQKNRKAKKKEGGKRRQDSEAEKGEKGKNLGKAASSKGWEKLTTYFSNEELQELRNVLKAKELTNVPLVVAAVILHKFELTRKLVQKGCNLNEMGPNHTSALMWAVKHKNMDITDFLLSNGADPTAKNDNGDSVLFLALENKLWDEKSYVSLWNHIKNVAFVDVDFVSKTGRTMLHTVVRREWNDMLNALIVAKANVNAENSNGMTALMLASYFNNLGIVNTLLQAGADVLKQDSNSCTALCYAVSYIINKSGKLPHLVVDKLVAKLRSLDVTFKGFFKARIDLILNVPVRRNKSGQPLPDTKAFIIPYALQYMEHTLQILLEVDIFKKIAEVAEGFINEPFQMIKYLTIINEILKWCNAGNGLVEKQLITSFITNGGADTCLTILKRYGFENPFEYDFISSAFTPLATTCSTQIEGRSWLYNNCVEILPFHAKFLITQPAETSDNVQVKTINENILNFNELVDTIKKEKAFYDADDLNVELRIKTMEARQNPPRAKDSPNAKQEAKSNSKKTKRRAKAMKAKIAKIKSADLTERLNNQNGKKILEQKCASDTSLMNQTHKNKKAEIGSFKIDPRSTRWPQHTAWEQVWLVDNRNYPDVQEFNETITALENQIVTDVKSEMFCSDVRSEIESVETVPKYSEMVSLYPDWKSRNLPSPIGTPRMAPGESPTKKSEEFKWSKPSEFAEQGDDANSNTKPSESEIKEMLNYTLNYLLGLLQRIIITYQNHWERDKQECGFNNDHGDVTNQHDKLGSFKTTMEKLEIEHIDRVQREFDKVIARIKGSADTHFLECSKLIDRLESLLLNHKIRGKSIIQDTPMQLININDDFDEPFDSFCKINRELSVPKYMESFLNKSRSGDDDGDSVINISYSAKIDSLQEHPDALYIQEVLALPPKRPQNPEKIKRDKRKTMKSENCYHLVESIIAICDDSDDAILTKQEEAKKERPYPNVGTSKYRRRQTLHETLLAMPKVDDPSKLLEALEKKHGNVEYLPPSENTPSRWCSIIRSFQAINKYQTLLNGDIRISNKDKQSSHTISAGGNFNTVLLGLDAKDRPLAVKRIRKDCAVCKVMKNLINPLLGLRNTNLLHYFSCNYEDNELVLATPLCEYNMGEYVMIMKQSPNMYVRAINIVKQFLAGLRFLHDRIDPIVHGNLKPSNIFIDLNGTVRIAEFGMHKALYILTDAPNTSIIWFSRETFTTFKETSSIICSCASDIQVAGMLLHFMLTAGKHPYGETMQDILKNLERAIPQVASADIDLQDLIAWMLLYEPSERPSINQVLSHVFFWSIDRKWRFILACAGVSLHGTVLNIPLNELHLYINIVAARDNIKGRWITMTKKRFPNLTYSKNDHDSITGLLRFVRSCMQNQVAFHINVDCEFRNFILSSFHALPLSLYRILESSQWLHHRILQPFTTVDSLSM